jgi:putative ABC transport system substrate-binding protein
MRRRTLLALIAAAALLPRGGLRAQTARKVWRIGVLESAPEELNAANLGAFRKGMLELGYVEGRDFVLEYRFLADGPTEEHRQVAADLVADGVDLIVTRGSPAVAAAQHATATIPIVMASNAEPLGLGIVDSLARPRGNVTGLSGLTVELVPKQIELLRDVAPAITRIAVMNNMSSSVGAARWEVIRGKRQALGIEPLLYDIRNSEALSQAFASASEAGAQALLFSLDHAIRSNLQSVVELAMRYRLPAIYGSREFVIAGGLMSYGPPFPKLYFRAASFVDRIFRGTKPADIPVEQPTAVELIINIGTARQLGLTISPALLARADEVIE